MIWQKRNLRSNYLWDQSIRSFFYCFACAVMRVCFLEWCKRTRTTSMFQLVLHFCHPHVLRDDWPPADIICLEEKNSSRIRSKLLRRKRLTWIGALKFSSSAERQSSGQGACNLMKRRMFLDLSNTSCNDGMNKTPACRFTKLTSSISSPLLCNPAMNFCLHRLNRCRFLRPL